MVLEIVIMSVSDAKIEVHTNEVTCPKSPRKIPVESGTKSFDPQPRAAENYVTLTLWLFTNLAELLRYCCFSL